MYIYAHTCIYIHTYIYTQRDIVYIVWILILGFQCVLFNIGLEKASEEMFSYFDRSHLFSVSSRVVFRMTGSFLRKCLCFLHIPLMPLNELIFTPFFSLVIFFQEHFTTCGMINVLSICKILSLSSLRKKNIGQVSFGKYPLKFL